MSIPSNFTPEIYYLIELTDSADILSRIISESSLYDLTALSYDYLTVSLRPSNFSR